MLFITCKKKYAGQFHPGNITFDIGNDPLYFLILYILAQGNGESNASARRPWALPIPIPSDIISITMYVHKIIAKKIYVIALPKQTKNANGDREYILK